MHKVRGCGIHDKEHRTGIQGMGKAVGFGGLIRSIANNPDPVLAKFSLP